MKKPHFFSAFLLRRSFAWAGCGSLACSLLACSPQVESPQAAGANLVSIGPGLYARVAPVSESGPAHADGSPVKPQVSAQFSQLPQTNDWWSGLIWKWDTKNPAALPVYPHPLSAQALRSGLAIGYPDQVKLKERDYAYPHKTDLMLSVTGLADATGSRATAVSVDSYSDWTVTALWKNGAASMLGTLGHGLPFVYLTKLSGDALIMREGKGSEVDEPFPSAACFSQEKHHYCAFAPLGIEWQKSGDSLIAPGAQYYSVAILPDAKPETRALFRKHAYAYVTGSTVMPVYQRAKGRLEATYTLEVDYQVNIERSVQDSGADHSLAELSSEPLIALYRHQALHTNAPVREESYVSPRGRMPLLAASSFTTSMPVDSLLPVLPPVPESVQSELESYVKVAAGREAFPLGLEGTRDSYWEAKSFGRLSAAIQIAEQLAMKSERDEMLDAVKKELEDWFDGQQPRLFFYDATWHTIVGSPTMYHSGAMLNDHHFHYAYFIYAAAIVGLYDRAWAQKWAPAVELLIRDAGCWDRTDKMFPFLRYFDPYAGHSWASGTVMGERGNNEESSAEDLNFAAALALWGEVMAKPKIRDMGLYLHSTLTASVVQYWYDVDKKVYPAGFQHPAVGIVWGNGAAYDTWFSYQPAFIHGIQLTPMHAGMYFMGRHPKAIQEVMTHTEAGNDGTIRLWRDMFWMFASLENAENPSQWFEEEHYFAPEFGTTSAHTFHTIESLKRVGRLKSGITADTPLFAVFQHGSTLTHVAFNASDRPQTVRFSDGSVLQAAPHSLATDLPSPTH